MAEDRAEAGADRCMDRERVGGALARASCAAHVVVIAVFAVSLRDLDDTVYGDLDALDEAAIDRRGRSRSAWIRR